MILHDKVEQIRGFFLQAWVDILPGESLVYAADTSFKGAIFLYNEKVALVSELHFIDYISALFVG